MLVSNTIDLDLCSGEKLSQNQHNATQILHSIPLLRHRRRTPRRQFELPQTFLHRRRHAGGQIGDVVVGAVRQVLPRLPDVGERAVVVGGAGGVPLLQPTIGRRRRQRPGEAEAVAGGGAGEVEGVAGEDFEVCGGGGMNDFGAERGISGVRANVGSDDVVWGCWCVRKGNWSEENKEEEEGCKIGVGHFSYKFDIFFLFDDGSFKYIWNLKKKSIF